MTTTLVLEDATPWMREKLRDWTIQEDQTVPHSVISMPPETACTNGVPMRVRAFCDTCEKYEIFQLTDKPVRNDPKDKFNYVGSDCATRKEIYMKDIRYLI